MVLVTNKYFVRNLILSILRFANRFFFLLMKRPGPSKISDYKISPEAYLLTDVNYVKLTSQRPGHKHLCHQTPPVISVVKHLKLFTFSFLLKYTSVLFLSLHHDLPSPSRSSNGTTFKTFLHLKAIVLSCFLQPFPCDAVD
jgi:hypothetical protein